MCYTLLTGATGLLGSYLLRDGLRAGESTAALVRPTRKMTATQRIEAVLERRSPCSAKDDGGNGGTADGWLPRPVVLAGDLTRHDLELDGSSVAWLEAHCESLIHNAASLQFRGRDRRGEPWRTNVEGTRRILDLCRTVGIKHFHYVSTAYVCGLRDGRIMEEELDLGQVAGNDYERSKIESERMVREADFFESVTVYRPAIIVGDSKTGQTSSYNGFYAILKLAHTLVSRVELGVTGGAKLASILGLGENDCKHFVPVDWVCAAITAIRRQPACHGYTYHLTADQPTRIIDMAEVIQEAVERYSPSAEPGDPDKLDGRWFEAAFHDQLKIYQSYWRDDPAFDKTNTQWALPHLPCPTIDREMLMHMAPRAIEARFGRALNPSASSGKKCSGLVRSAERSV